MAKMINKNRKGLTLIELLASITIMGILILISIPSVSKVIENTRKKTFVNQINFEVIPDFHHTPKRFENLEKRCWQRIRFG